MFFNFLKLTVNIVFFLKYKMYRAFAASFLTRPWCIGVIFWHWNMYGPDAKGYSPQGKPALEIVRKEFDRFC